MPEIRENSAASEAHDERTSSAPRNREAFAIGRQRRDLIRALLLERAARFPLARPLTGEQIRQVLRRHGVHLAVTTIRWHVEQIRVEADREVSIEAE
ncbi:MAG TPA: hypothetical protein VFX20_13955 [Steroidobacteraceae bacterium]|nr:hypothetical protein [Steroidobacteraceae bacterium]